VTVFDLLLSNTLMDQKLVTTEAHMSTIASAEITKFSLSLSLSLSLSHTHTHTHTHIYIYIYIYIYTVFMCGLIRLLSTAGRAAAFFWASGAALSQVVPTVK
jgi:hypothetical protein